MDFFWNSLSSFFCLLYKLLQISIDYRWLWRWLQTNDSFLRLGIFKSFEIPLRERLRRISKAKAYPTRSVTRYTWRRSLVPRDYPICGVWHFFESPARSRNRRAVNRELYRRRALPRRMMILVRRVLHPARIRRVLVPSRQRITRTPVMLEIFSHTYFKLLR